MTTHEKFTRASGEEGMLSIVALVVVFGFLLLLCAMMNTGAVVTQKLEAQNAADATATTAAVELARGMNAVTAANHLIGELTALVVLHHSLGGDELDGLRPAQGGGEKGPAEGGGGEKGPTEGGGGEKGPTEGGGGEKGPPAPAGGPHAPAGKPLARAGGKTLREAAPAGGGAKGGGQQLGEVDPFQIVEVLLEQTHTLAETATDGMPEFLRPNDLSFEAISKPVQVGAAIGSARVRLKQIMTAAYVVHAMGGVLWQFNKVPVLGEPCMVIGLAISGVATAVEWKVYQECVVLDVLECVATALVIPKYAVVGCILGLQQYARLVVQHTPLAATAAATQVGTTDGATASLFPAAGTPVLDPFLLGPGFALPWTDPKPSLRLPVQQEPALLLEISPLVPLNGASTRWWDTAPYKPSNMAMEYAYMGLRAPVQSQLVRATSPWVQYWRVPIYVFGDLALTLSAFTQFYEFWSNEFTQVLAGRLKLLGVNLYVMTDLDQINGQKGQEPWTHDSQRADQLFSVVGFGYRAPAPVMASFAYRQSNPDGIVAYAQAMIYNANPQVAPTGQDVPDGIPILNPLAGLTGQALIGQVTAILGAHPPAQYQPQVGWDTLNWGSQVYEHPGPALGPFGLPPVVPLPTISLGWQAKLVPTTRLKESLQDANGNVGTILRRLPAQNRPLDNTH
jgi:hypothetical protein